MMLWTRRDFLQRTALLAAMHAPLLASACGPAKEQWGEFRLKRLRLAANNLDEQAAFYRDVLRLPIEQPDANTLRVTSGESLIEFSPHAESTRPFYHFAFTIPENQSSAAMAWLEPRCPILNIHPRQNKTIHFRRWNADSFYFNDPAGNILEFIAHHDLDNGTGAQFDEQQILHVSEIGIVVPSVPAVQQQAEKSMGIRPYREYASNFAPLGSIHGVLIVVPEERVWLPTADVHAAVFPTQVEATGATGEMEFDGLPYHVTAQA